jgi:hypothetical protein
VARAAVGEPIERPRRAGHTYVLVTIRATNNGKQPGIPFVNGVLQAIGRSKATYSSPGQEHLYDEPTRGEQELRKRVRVAARRPRPRTAAHRGVRSRSLEQLDVRVVAVWIFAGADAPTGLIDAAHGEARSVRVDAEHDPLIQRLTPARSRCDPAVRKHLWGLATRSY